MGSLSPRYPQLMLSFFSVFCLVVANCTPLAGVFFLGWDVSGILIIYWLENLVVGVFTVLKILFAENRSFIAVFSKFFHIPFFCVHYGIFCLVHAAFLTSLLQLADAPTNGGPFKVVLQLWLNRPEGFAAVLFTLIISHGVAFYDSYIKGKERQLAVKELMGQPYPRIIVLHCAILTSAVAVRKLDSPLPLLVALILFKTVLDLFLTTKQTLRKRSAPLGAPAAFENISGS